MEVESQAQSADAKPAKEESPPPPRPATTYAPVGSTAGRSTTASPGPSIYCVECGTRFPRTEDACPNCGYRIDDSLERPPEKRRRPRARLLHPVQGYLPILGAILIPVGLVFLLGAPLAHDLFRRRPMGFWLPLFFVIGGGVIEVTALALCLVWLYQAWRMVLHGDEEYSPGLMVGLLFVPFFNFYWMFRAIPGLSTAIQDELKVVAPTRSYSAGWVPGLAACIFALIPYGQPVAVCIFLAWMLITNHAVNRLLRFHEELREVTRREEAEFSRTRSHDEE